MIHTAFFDVVRQTAHAAMSGSQPPSLGGKLLTQLKIIAKCFDGDEVVTVDDGTAQFLILAKTSATGAASLIDTTAVLNTSDPDEPQYEFEWNPADSVQLRAVLDAAADPTVAVELRYEFRFERGGEKGCIGGPIWFLNNFFRPETPAPEATLNTSWETLKSRVQAGANLTRTVNDTTQVITFTGEDSEANAAAIAAETTARQSADTALQTAQSAHAARVDNPHAVTKSQVGLGNVDNTSDANKPVSTAQQAALDSKAASADLSAHTSRADNPHAVTKAQVGLGNVDNTSDANKPVSAATQTALNAKAAASHTHNAGDITVGILDAARLPTPGATTLGGVKRNTGGAGQFLNGIDASGALLYDTPAGGGSAISLPLQAWLETGANGGNDTTGTVGDPSKPYATFAAALADGARVLHIGEGTFAGYDADFGADLDIAVTGLGPTRSIVTILRNRGRALTVRDLGCQSVHFTTLSTEPDTAATDANGATGGTMTLHNVVCDAASVTGGLSGGLSTDGNGLTGGNGGILRVSGLLTAASIDFSGRVGGDGYGASDYNGGQGGTAGSLVALTGQARIVVTGNVTGGGGAGGAPANSGTAGQQGSGGTVDNLLVDIGGTLNLSGFSGGSLNRVTGRAVTVTLSGDVVNGTSGALSYCHFLSMNELNRDGANQGTLTDCSHLYNKTGTGAFSNNPLVSVVDGSVV